MQHYTLCGLCDILILTNRCYLLSKLENLFQRIDDLYQLLHPRDIAKDVMLCETCLGKNEKRRPSSISIGMLKICTSVEFMNVDVNILLVNAATKNR